MGKGLFTADTLTKALGKDGVEQLTQIGIDSGQAFLSGKVTNAMIKVATTDSISSTINAAATAFGTYEFGKQVYKNADEIATTLAASLVTEATTIITKEIGRLSGEYIGKHAAAAAAWPGQVMNYAMKTFNEEKLSVGDVLKALKEASEDRMEKQTEDEKKKRMTEFMSKMKDTMNDVNSYVSKYVDIGTSYIQMVTSYIANGPDWVVDQMDKQLSNLSNMAEKELTKQWEKDKKLYDESAKSTGESIGGAMAEKFNKQLQHAQDKLLKKMEKQKQKALSKASAIKGKAKSKIASITGIYIPA